MKFDVLEDRDEWVFRSVQQEQFRASNPDKFLAEFIEFVSHAFLEILPAETVVFHSACFLHESELLILYGDSNAGKSTAALRLLDEPLEFLSDEIGAVRSSDGKVFPFPRPLNLDPDTAIDDELDTYQIDTSSGSGVRLVFPPASRVCYESTTYDRLHVVALNRGEHTVSLDRLKPSTSLIRLMEHCLRPESKKERFRSLGSMMRGDMTVYELQYRNFDDAKDLLLDLIDL